MTRVLVIEDDETIQRAIARVIRRALPDPATEIVLVDNAATAIGYLAGGRVDLVISDYDLAGEGTGADVLAWIRANRPVPFVFVSGNDAIVALGVPFLAKPCTSSELRDLIVAQVVA